MADETSDQGAPAAAAVEAAAAGSSAGIRIGRLKTVKSGPRECDRLRSAATKVDPMHTATAPAKTVTTNIEGLRNSNRKRTDDAAPTTTSTAPVRHRLN